MYGYDIINGKAIPNDEAKIIKKIFKNYIKGYSLEKSAELAGAKLYHPFVKRILQNKVYIGDGFYPAIIDKNTFNSIHFKEVKRNVKKRLLPSPSTEFKFNSSIKCNLPPKEKAEYIYSLIKEKNYVKND